MPWEPLGLPSRVLCRFPVGPLSTIEQIRFLDMGFVLFPPVLPCISAKCLRTLEIDGLYLDYGLDFFLSLSNNSEQCFACEK